MKKAPAPPVGWISKTLQDALDGDRTSALALWRQVAEDPNDEESVTWVRAVAQRLLEADEADRKRRQMAIVEAVGLAGYEDRARALREKIEIIQDFENLDRKAPPARGEESQALFDYVRTLPEFEEYLRETPSFKAYGRTMEIFKHDLTNEEIRKIVDNITK